MEIPEERDVDQNDPEENVDKEHEDEGEIPAEGKQNGWEKVLFFKYWRMQSGWDQPFFNFCHHYFRFNLI